MDTTVDEAILAEREACARIADGMATGMDCDERGCEDPETGSVSCRVEDRGGVCVCVERSNLACAIATKIRGRTKAPI